VLNRCIPILANPSAFNSDVVALCRKISKL